MSSSVYIFFLPTCPHCIEMKPHLQKVWSQFKDKAKFYMVDASDERMRGYVDKYRITQAPSFVVERPGKDAVAFQTSDHQVLIQKLRFLLD